MQKNFSIPLLFLFLAALIGLLLRWQFVQPFDGIVYRFWLHAHSHVMFLGWVFNALLLAFISQHIQRGAHRPFYIIFYLLQVFIAGMMIAFPLQGYGPYAIAFSMLHTLTALMFIFRFFRATEAMGTASIWFARTALLFFILSSAGPAMLGYLMANGMGQTPWYHFSVYFYLHFQYNGVFIFGVFSLFFQLLADKGIVFQHGKAKIIGWWMALSCLAAYSLSVLWAQPGLVANTIGFVSGCAQMYALYLFIRFFVSVRNLVTERFSALALFYLYLVFSAFVLKLVLQMLSAHPAVAELAWVARPVVIAYLHLVVVGIVSMFLLVWYLEMTFARRSLWRAGLTLFTVGYIGSEVGLVSMPWWPELPVVAKFDPHQWMFIFSALMVLAASIFLAAFSRARKG